MKRTRVVIAGAAGRDFHNFNVVYRGRDDVEVVAFTATQIPNIDGRVYPRELAGDAYPDGIPILPGVRARADRSRARDRPGRVRVLGRHARARDARRLARARRRRRLPAPLAARHDARVDQAGCRIGLRCAHRLWQEPDHPPRLADFLREMGYRVAAIRHPMPYGDLGLPRRCSASPTIRTWITGECTIEEREEYEPHIDNGRDIRLRGRGLRSLLRQAEQEVDIVLWDGGNNDFSFYQSDLSGGSSWSTRTELAATSLPPWRDQHPPGGRVCDQQGGSLSPRRASSRCANNPSAQSIRLLEVVEAASPLFVDDPRRASAASACW